MSVEYLDGLGHGLLGLVVGGGFVYGFDGGGKLVSDIDDAFLSLACLGVDGFAV